MHSELRPHQVAALDMLRQSLARGNRRPMLQAPTGFGKCLGYGTPVLMADGSIRPVQEIRVGDRLASPAGAPNTVLSLARGREDLWRITPRKGDPWVCNGSHLLSLRMTATRHRVRFADGQIASGAKGEHIVIAARDFAASAATARRCAKLWRPERVEFDRHPSPLPVSPYILGIWLGDGTLGKASITKPEGIVSRVWSQWGAEMGCTVRRCEHGGRCPTWHLRTDRGQPNPALEALDAAGVRNEKHIPPAYRQASELQRRELLAGLLDTDGHAANGGFEITAKSRALAEGIAHLARSVGLAASLTAKRGTIKATGFAGEYWRVSISGDCDAIPTLAKVARARRQIKDHRVSGFTIEPIGPGDYFGFELSGDRLFMLGDFTVTHNTIVAAEIVDRAVAKGKRVGFVAPALSLIDQTVEKFFREGIRDVGVIQADHPMSAPQRPVQVCSVQTLMRRPRPDLDLVLVDEAHRDFKFMREWMTDPEWARVPFIGLSATPWTRGLGKSYDDLIIAATVGELIDSGFLSDFRVFAPGHPDLSKVKTVAGDYHEGQLGEVMNDAGLVADVVATWLELGEDRPTLVFAVDRAHARHLQERFNAAGVSTGYVDAFTSGPDRAEIARRFHAGEIRVVCNVGCLTTGVDWDVRCIVLARPTRSEMLHVQIIGRGLRTAEGKADCLILDHADNTNRLGFVTDIVHEELDDGSPKPAKRPEEAKPLPKECPKCSFMKPPKVRTCPNCAHEPAVPVGGPAEEDGQLVERTRQGKPAKAKATKDDKQLWFSAFLRIGEERGYKPGWAANQYCEKFGVWPQGLANVSGPVPAEVRSWAKAQLIRYAKRREREARNAA